MRVTDSFIFTRFLNAFNLNRQASERAVLQLADGKRVRYASDDPTGARTAIEFRGRLVRLEGFKRTTQTSNTDLATIESVLGEVFNIVSEARSEAMAGATGLLANPVVVKDHEGLWRVLVAERA